MLHWLRRKTTPAVDGAPVDEARRALAAGEDARAIALLDAHLGRRPEDGRALHLRAVAACRGGDFALAQAYLSSAADLEPGWPEPSLTLAEVHLHHERFDAAVEALRAALACEPNRPETHQRLLFALGSSGRADEAVEYWQLLRGLDGRIDPATNPAAALHAQGRLAEADDLLESLVRDAPGDANLHVLLGITRQARGLIDAAILAFGDAVRADGEFARAQGKLAFALDSRGDVEASLPHYARAAALAPGSAQAWSDLLAARIYLGPHSVAETAAAYRAYEERFGAPLHNPAPFRLDVAPERKLRVAYVSNDLSEHVVSYFLEPVLEHHDRSRFEVWCYDRTRHRDSTSLRLEARADAWHRVPDMDFESLAARVRADAIDILVDLKGHFDDNSLPLFARKPAPVQLTWLGYPDTTGLHAMDAWITDRHIAADLSGQYASERILPLDGFFMGFRPRPDAPDPGPLPVQSRGAVTFGCFNAYSKVSPAMRVALAQILGRVPDARLLMSAVPRGEARRRLLAEFGNAGIDPARIEIRGRGDHAEFLAWHREIDLALDSFPYNGTTTTLHALWMGVPFVTLAGSTHVARVGASILANVGLEDWIARSGADYVRLAAEKAADPAGLAALRAGLRERVERSPIRDETGFTKRLEAAYRECWRGWCARGPSASAASRDGPPGPS
jgi:predicted O-linked N-acetylglucosamine transferase (SPINDLY family)